jgi:pimeloyl-ACP methyl ester carboxylesterase
MGLAYECRGAGPTMVLLHGVGHRRQAWNVVLGLLTPHRTVITVDLPGHGASPPLRGIANGRPAVRAIAAEILAFFDELGLDRPHVAGNSLGGALALLVGAAGRAASVTGLSPAGFWASPWQFGYAKAVFMSAQLTGPAVRPLVPALARNTLGRSIMDGPFVAMPSRMTPEQAAADALAFFSARPAVKAVLDKRVSFTEPIPAGVPVTIAWGTKDRLLPPSQARVAMRRLPQARFVPLTGCGHVPMTDNPGLVAKVLLDGSTASGGTTPLDPRMGGSRPQTPGGGDPSNPRQGRSEPA